MQATLVGAKVWVFGGEDAARRPLDDVHVINLADMSWTTPQLAGKGPSRRSAHTAAAYADRWLLVFGGGSLVRDLRGKHLIYLLANAVFMPVSLPDMRRSAACAIWWSLCRSCQQLHRRATFDRQLALRAA